MAHELQVGEYLGPYCLTQRLGEGGMGVVFKAHDGSLNRTVAIKILSSKVARDREFSARFLHEARAVAALNHPNIVQIYYVAQQNDILFFAMEFVEGMSLDHLLHERGKLAEDEALELMLEAARGLQHAQRHGMIHRDIKPANLIVTTEGDVKIADFGLSKKMSGESIALTAAMAIVGTPLYMSPEQGRALPLDHRTDIYALGITLYHLLAGRPPFLGENSMSIMLQHISNLPPPIQQFCPTLSLASDRILNKMMAKLPEQRYQTYEELIRDFEAVLDNQTAQPVSEVTAPAELSELEPQPRRSPLLVGALILLIGILAWSLWNHGSQPAPLPVPPDHQTLQPVPPSSTGSTPVSPPGTAATPEVQVDKGEESARWARAISLLPLMDPAKDAVAGGWERRGSELVSDGYGTNLSGARIEIPYVPPPEYDFRMRFTRQQGEWDVCQILAAGDKNFAWNMGAARNTVFGFALVNGHHAETNPTGMRTERCLENGRRYVSLVQVRKDGVKAFLDGDLVTQWDHLYDLSLYDFWKLKSSSVLGVGSLASPTTFHSLEILEVNGVGKFTRPDDPAAKAEMARQKAMPVTVVAAGSPNTTPNPPVATGEVDDPTRWAKAMNLLLLAEGTQSAVSGMWRVSASTHALFSDNLQKTRLQFPYRPPAEYDYQVVLARQTGEDDVILIASKNRRQFCWKMGAGDTAGGHNIFWGFDLIQNRHVSQNPTGKRMGLENGRKYACILQVRKDAVKAYVDGKLVTEWKTNYNDFTIEDSFRLPDPEAVGVSTWNSPTIFFSAQVLDVTGKGQFLNPEDPAAKEEDKKRNEAASTSASPETTVASPDSHPPPVVPPPAVVSAAAKADSREDQILSETTKRALPTEAEWTKLKALVTEVKNGDDTKVKELVVLREKLYRRFCTAAEKWTAADFQARLEADAKIYALCKPTHYKGMIGVSLWNHLSDYLKQAKTPDQLAERLRALPALYVTTGVDFVDRAEDPDGSYTYWYGGTDKFREFISRKVREGIGKFIHRSQSRYQIPTAKTALMDFLKAQGVDDPVLDEMKHDFGAR